MPENQSFSIRAMRQDDLDQAFALSFNEGWNQTMKDWRLLLDNPDNVCIVAERDKMVAGTATAIIHENRTAWIGMVLVDKSLRGLGAGKLLLGNIIGRLGHVESVRLDATPAGEPLYRNLGFIEEHKIIRMTCSSLNFIPEADSSIEVHRIDRKSISGIIELDRTIFGSDRSYLLTTLLGNYPEKAFYLKNGKSVAGYIFARDGSRFNYIGPANVLQPASAGVLILKVLELLNNQAVALDIMEDKVDLIKMLESLGFVKQRHFSRMYLKVNPYPGIVSNQYLISGPEFG